MMRRTRRKRPPRTGGMRPRIADALSVVAESRDARARDAQKGRRRRSAAVSFILHASLLTFLLVARPSSDELGTLTEIAYIDEAALQPAPAVATQPVVEQPLEGTPNPGPKDTRFARDIRPAEQQPVPQDDYSLSDQLSSRLSAMRSTSQQPVTGLPTPDLPRASASLVKTDVQSPRIALQRGKDEATHVPSIALNRSAREAPARVTTSLPAERSKAAPASAGGDATARVRLAGAELVGPVANRPIVAHRAPTYPEWAKRDGVEASVTLHFVVRPDGSIKENILIERTSGYGDFDDRALEALSEWRFAPLTGGRTGEQWGVITLHFRLREGKS